MYILKYINTMHYEARLEELFHLADLDIKDGYYEAAVKKLEDILVENPNFGKAYNHLGWMYETKFRDLGKAEEFYKKALERAPEYPAIYTNYSILLSTLGKFNELELLLNQALTVPGVDKANIYNEFGIMYEQTGNYEKAIEFYKQCGRQTLAKDTLDRALASIERCKTKQTLM